MSVRLTLAAMVALAAAGLLAPTPSDAQITQSLAVLSCGSPPTVRVPGGFYPDTADTSGIRCTSSTGGGGGGGAVTAAANSYATGFSPDLGKIGDSACPTDNGAACDLIQLVMRTNQRTTTMIAGIGAPSDTAWSGSGDASAIALLKAIALNSGGSLPAGAAAIGSLTADTHAQCAALCANLVVKNAPGTLKTFEVSADSTLSGATWYVMVSDSTTTPGDGAVTPAKCYQQASGTTQMGGTLGPGGTSYPTGIDIYVSTTGCFTKTSSTHAFIAADFQ